jgi:GxxExxY protein
MGDFGADLVIQNVLVVEWKTLVAAHSVQLFNYLSDTRLDFGLLINFGTKSLQFKTKTMEYTPDLKSLI